MLSELDPFTPKSLGFTTSNLELYHSENNYPEFMAIMKHYALIWHEEDLW